MSTLSLKFPQEKLCKCFKYYPDVDVEKAQRSERNEYVPPRRVCDDVPAGYKTYQNYEKGSPGIGTGYPFRTALEHSDEPEMSFQDYEVYHTPVTLHHIIMDRVCERIRDKKDWWVKIENDALWNKWMNEAAAAFPTTAAADGFNAKARRAMREELRWLATQREKKAGFENALNYTVKADNLIPDGVKQELLAGVAKLENVPEHLKDWHPGSENRVLDLVHPSLYPIMYGITRVQEEPILFDPDTIIRDHSMKGELLPAPINRHADDSRFRTSVDFPDEEEFEKAVKERYLGDANKESDPTQDEVSGESKEHQDAGIEAEAQDDLNRSESIVIGHQEEEEGKEEEEEEEEEEEGTEPQGENDDASDVVMQGTQSAIDSAASSASGHTEVDQPEPFESYQDKVYSKKYCWLPTDFHIDKETGKVTPAGYINNLHPRIHAPLYSTISAVLEKCVPLFNEVLTQTISPIQDRTPESCYSHWVNVTLEEYRNTPPRCRYTEDENEVLEDIQSNLRYLRSIYPHLSEEELQKRAEVDVFRIFRIPPCYDFRPPLVSQYSRVDLSKHHRIQVIVKLANIMLTPEKPTYGGGSWHVEGALNERIVASAIYYYDCENVTENELAFRKKCEIPDYEQSDDRGVELAYGLSSSTGLVQELGSIVTKQDRVIAFPNIFQHRVSPLKLIDPTKPGHRKILCFFLIDPFHPIPSTTNIGPQQGEWWEEESRFMSTLGQRVPPELFQHIFSYVEEPLSLDKAKEVRLDLMKERGISDKAVSANHRRDFTLCEH